MRAIPLDPECDKIKIVSHILWCLGFIVVPWRMQCVEVVGKKHDRAFEDASEWLRKVRAPLGPEKFRALVESLRRFQYDYANGSGRSALTLLAEEVNKILVDHQELRKDLNVLFSPKQKS